MAHDNASCVSVEVRPGQRLVCANCQREDKVPDGQPFERLDLVCRQCGHEHPVVYATAPIVAAPLFVTEQPLWVQLLVKEISTEEQKGRGKAGVALRLGFKRAYVSRAIATLEGRSSGFPGGVPQSFIDRVLNRLHVIAECPATELPQPRSECQRIGNGPAPTHNPLAMRIWKECQRCPNKPAQEKE